MNNNKIERRILAAKLTLRAADDDEDSPGNLEGYAAVFNSRSQDLGGFIETMNPGCFDRVLASKPDVRCLMNHDANLVLGRTTNRTLVLHADNKGLMFSCKLPNTSTGRDVYSLIQRGDISQCSFAFGLEQGDDEWTQETDSATGKQNGLRTIRNVSHLFDVSSVTSPAYEATSVSARNLGANYFMPTVPNFAPIAALPTKFDLHRRSVEIGKRIEAENYNAGLADFINNRPRPNVHVEEK
jgi:Escherichia/Staphylococcus phage prohead protease